LGKRPGIRTRPSQLFHSVGLVNPIGSFRILFERGILRTGLPAYLRLWAGTPPWEYSTQGFLYCRIKLTDQSSHGCLGAERWNLVEPIGTRGSAGSAITVDRLLRHLTHTKGDSDQAEVHLDDALAFSNELDVPPLTERILSPREILRARPALASDSCTRTAAQNQNAKLQAAM